MFSRVINSFIHKPSLYYSMSIAATWAGVGSLIVGIQMAQDYGIIPFLLWALGNTLACIVFGIFAPTIPKLRDVFRSKPMHFIVGSMCIFQIWLNMNGIQTIFRDTPLSGKVPVVIVAHADEAEDMYGTITHNRARGTHLLEPMKAIVKKLIDDGKTVKEISKQLGMKPEEVFRLSDFSKEEFLAMMTKGVKGYSKAEVLAKI